MLSEEHNSSDEHDVRNDCYEALGLDRLLAIEARKPNDVALLICIGKRYFEAYNFDKCREYYVRALKLDPYDGWSHLYFGNLLSALGCHESALVHFNYAADFLPDVACPQWCLAEQYRGAGDFDKADDHYRNAVSVDPEDATARGKLNEWLASYNTPG